MKRKLLVAGAVCLAGLLVSWFFLRAPKPRVDLKEVTDARIDDWIKTYPQQDAIEFLEKGGKFSDKNPQLVGMDREVVLPFLKRLADETHNRAIVLLYKENPKIAGAAAVPMPSDSSALKDLKSFMVREDKAYDGVILRQYGRHWMYLDFMDPKTARASRLENWDVE